MKLVMCHGVFDLLHSGHIEHFRQAREMGDQLLISVVPDRFVTKLQRPIFKENERLSLLRAIKYVDIVELCDGPGPHLLLRKHRPAVYVRGSDYVGRETPEHEVLRELGIEIRYTNSVPPTTSELLGRIMCALRS